jgi:hypothetical protein
MDNVRKPSNSVNSDSVSTKKVTVFTHHSVHKIGIILSENFFQFQGAHGNTKCKEVHVLQQ